MRLFETQLDENVEQEKPASIDQQGTNEQLSEEETGLMEKRKQCQASLCKNMKGLICASVRRIPYGQPEWSIFALEKVVRPKGVLVILF